MDIRRKTHSPLTLDHDLFSLSNSARQWCSAWLGRALVVMPLNRAAQSIMHISRENGVQIGA